jgi:hypothetical protein
MNQHSHPRGAREPIANRSTWQDSDVVMELDVGDGVSSRISRRVAKTPARQIRRWLQIGEAVGGGSARIVQPFFSEEGLLFEPEHA